MSNPIVVYYGDYPNGLPECENFCINHLYSLGIKVYGIGKELDVDKYKNYVQYRLGRSNSELKPNHYADYLGYNSIEILDDVYGIKVDKVLKVDTDYLITSKFILNDLFNLNKYLVGIDNGYLIRYGSEIPNRFFNAHILYNVSSDRLSSLVTDNIFNEYLNNYWENNHYTATGPYLLNNLAIKDNNLTPWTSDPSSWSLGKISDKHIPGALGYHFQSSVAKSLGYRLTDFNLDGDTLTYYIKNIQEEL